MKDKARPKTDPMDLDNRIIRARRIIRQDKRAVRQAREQFQSSARILADLEQKKRQAGN